MKKFAVLFSLFLSAPLFATQFNPYLSALVQSETKGFSESSALFSFLFGEEEAPEQIPVFGKGNYRQARRNGAEIQTVAGDYFTALVDVNDLNDFSDLSSVESLSYLPPVQMSMDNAASEISLSTARSFGFSGGDVIIGIVDSGLDVTHPDFLSANGLSRVLYYWDQNNPSSRNPSGFDYGREWSKDDIDNGKITATDDNGHGTHVAGIAAGNGESSGGLFEGVASEANLVIVDLNFSSAAAVLDAVSYIFEIAEEQGKPCVVNLSLGGMYGSHTANDPFNEAMDALVEESGGEGRILVWAAGNFGNDDQHGTNRTSTLLNTSLWVDYTAAVSLSTAELIPMSVYCYYSNDTRIGVSVRAGAETLISETTADTSTYTSSSGNVSLYQQDYGNGMTMVALISEETENRNYRLVFGSTDSPVDIHGYISGASPYHVFAQPVAEGSLSSLAAQDLSIGVGAYVSKTFQAGTFQDIYWTNDNLGEIAYFSSLGPAADGGEKPEIVAPGALIVSALSSSIGEVTTQVGSNSMALQGTSMSAPVVTGAIALLLSIDPTLTVDEVRSLLIDSAAGNAYKTAGSWDEAYGYGLLSLADFGSMTNTQEQALEVSVYNNVLNFQSDTDNFFEIRLQSVCDFQSDEVSVKVLDSLGGEIHDFGSVSLSGLSEESLIWNGEDQSGNTVEGGIYFAVIESSGDRELIRILVVR